MEGWHEIVSQRDIDDLQEQYDGFHDACIVSLAYESGTFTDADGAMHFGDAAAQTARLLLHSQTQPPLELRFCGLRRISLRGASRFSEEIFEAYLAFCETEAGRGIVWADCADFDTAQGGTFLIADGLQWRMAKRIGTEEGGSA